MSRLQRQANLDDLCQNLDNYSKTLLGIPTVSSAAAVRLSDSLYLAHSTSDLKFSDICAAGYLASAARLAAGRNATVSTGCTEAILGTAGAVFLYVSAFRYPNTGCGLLFATSLEFQHRDDGVATPFDSGGLLKCFVLPGPGTPQQFLSRHELPIPEHRRYLGLSMDVLFNSPRDYADGTDPGRPGPIGLTGGDCRRWTHEVRIPDRVFLRVGHLQAAFAPRSRVAAEPEIEALFKWCDAEGVDTINFDTPRGDDSDALRRLCRDYIRKKLY